jgi:hypothetical protein
MGMFVSLGLFCGLLLRKLAELFLFHWGSCALSWGVRRLENFKRTLQNCTEF